jgi:C4-dicarboxylate-specific signal transduction histidine kinase
MGQLSAWIAHDVSQPLLGVMASGNAGLRWLTADPPNLEGARRAFERIVKDGHLAAEILDRTRALVKKSSPRQEPVDINEVISETFALVAAEAKRNGIVVKMDLAQALPVVSADRIQIQQVVLNLTLNAIEAMTADSTHPRDLTVVSGTDASGRAVVAIGDSGPGLTAEHRDRVFDAFHTTKPNGLGMGLAICRTIIETYGGSIWVTPNEPRGAVFQFALPDAAESTPLGRGAGPGLDGPSAIGRGGPLLRDWRYAGAHAETAPKDAIRPRRPLHSSPNADARRSRAIVRARGWTRRQ